MWQDTFVWSGARSVLWWLALNCREAGRRSRTGKKARVEKSAQPCSSSTPGSADTQVLDGKHSLFHGSGDSSCRREEQEAMPFLLCTLQWEKQSEEPIKAEFMSPLSEEPLVRASSLWLLTPWIFYSLWALYPVIAPGCGVLWVIVQGLLQPLHSASSFSQLCHDQLSWLWLFLCLLSVNFSCSIQLAPFAPISATIVPYFKQFWRISSRNKPTTKIKRKKETKAHPSWYFEAFWPCFSLTVFQVIVAN